MSSVAIKPADPVSELLERVGNIDNFEIFRNQVLVGVFIRPNVTAGGIHLTDATLDEDKYQGKVGLVLKMGPLAFVPEDDLDRRFDGMDIKIHDWVVFRTSETWQLKLNKRFYSDKGVDCRLIDDIYIRGRVQDPLMVY